MLLIYAQIVGKNGKKRKKFLLTGGDMEFKKIQIDKNNYIKLFEDGNFEVHCRASGPLGANVYFFENRSGGLLRWKQRRSYAFIAKRQSILYSND